MKEATRLGSQGGPCCQWAMCRQVYPALFFLIASLAQAHEVAGSDGSEGQNVINCGPYKKCDDYECTCRPPHHLCCSDRETTTTLFREFPRRPPVEPDYSGVVKLALGAAIVMLAGVILALVWNLYREKRRMARGASHSSRRNHGRTARNGRGRRAISIPPQDLPPSYNDIFIISSSEPGRRLEKPPSYEDAMRDEQRFRLLPPGPAYVNFGFTNDASSPQSGIFPSASHIVDMQNPGLRSAVISVPSSFTAASTSDGSLPSLNIASIIRRLRPAFVDPTTLEEIHVNSYASLESPCRRAIRGLSEPSVRKEMPDPIVSVRRTKSGRAGNTSLDFDNQFGNFSNSPSLDAADSLNSTPQHIQSVSSVELSFQECFDNHQHDASSSSQSVHEENLAVLLDTSSEEQPHRINDLTNQTALPNMEISAVALLKQCTSHDLENNYCDKNIIACHKDDEIDPVTMIISHDANTQEVPLGVLHATTAASDC